MKSNEIMAKVSSSMSKAMFTLKAHSSEILEYAGVIGVIGAGVLACRATLKLDSVLEEGRSTVEKIHECRENESLKEKYTEEDAQKDLVITCVQTGAKVAGLYAPAVILGTLSILAIVKSSSILRERNAALAEAYICLDGAFKKYRSRLIEKHGEQTDAELRDGIKAVTIERQEVDPETGKTKKIKETIDTIDGDGDGYMYVWSKETSESFTNSDFYNRSFLRERQSWANDQLKSRGYLFLNDLLGQLGMTMAKSRMGHVVGWVYDPENPNHTGDNYIELCPREVYTGDNDNGYAKAFTLEFNVDGPIMDLAWGKK